MLRFLAYLADLRDEREVVDGLLQAVAIWYDLDAYLYQRSSTGHFRMVASLPASDRAGVPEQIQAAALPATLAVARISTLVELEELGWRDPQQDVLLLALPMALPGESPRWLLLLTGDEEEDLEASLRVLGRSVGVFLDTALHRRARCLQQALIGHATPGEQALEIVASNMLRELLSAVSAVSARLMLDAGAGGDIRILASAGDDRLAAASDTEPAGAAWTTEVDLGSGIRARVELCAATGGGFWASDLVIADAGTRILGAWVAGAHAAGLGSRDSSDLLVHTAFERRIEEEVARAKRFELETGLLIVDLSNVQVQEQPGLVRAVVAAIRRELRASDLLGWLGAEAMAAVLVHTGRAGVETAARRIRERVEQLAREQRMPPVAVGLAAFPAMATSAEELVSHARRGIEGRTGDRMPES